MGVGWLLLLLGTAWAYVGEEGCGNAPASTSSCPVARCEGEVALGRLEEEELGEDCVFMLETSDRRVVTPRVACALESAASNSGLRVVMLRVGATLDLADNTTCHLYHGWGAGMAGW